MAKHTTTNVMLMVIRGETTDGQTMKKNLILIVCCSLQMLEYIESSNINEQRSTYYSKKY